MSAREGKKTNEARGECQQRYNIYEKRGPEQVEIWEARDTRVDSLSTPMGRYAHVVTLGRGKSRGGQKVAGDYDRQSAGASHGRRRPSLEVARIGL